MEYHNGARSRRSVTIGGPLQGPDAYAHDAQMEHLGRNFSYSDSGTIVKAIADYEGEDDQELSFKEGDLIILKETDASGWACGCLKGSASEGWFPLKWVQSTDPSVVLSSGGGSQVDLRSLVAHKELNSETLRKRISNRPHRKDLQEANILPDTDAAPSLLAAQKKLDRRKKTDFLSNFFRKKDKDPKGALEISKPEISFGDRILTFDDSVEETFEFTNSSQQKIKWLLDFNSYNQPYVLSFTPSFGSISKGKSQEVKVKVTVKNLATVDTRVRVSTPKGEEILNFSVKIKCRKGVFGVDPLTLDSTVDMGYKVPAVLAQLRESLRKNEGVKKEGIFRLSGDQYVVQQLKRQIDETRRFTDHKDVYSVSSLIKIWFRELPDPILQKITKEDLFQDETSQCLKAVDALPEPQKSLLLWLIQLVEEVNVWKDINKMTIENLAIVIAPNLYQIPTSTDPIEGLLISQKSAKFFGTVIRGVINRKQQTTGTPSQMKDSPVVPRTARHAPVNVSELQAELRAQRQFLEPNRRRSKSTTAIKVPRSQTMRNDSSPSSLTPPSIPRGAKPPLQPPLRRTLRPTSPVLTSPPLSTTRSQGGPPARPPKPSYNVAPSGSRSFIQPVPSIPYESSKTLPASSRPFPSSKGSATPVPPPKPNHLPTGKPSLS